MYKKGPKARLFRQKSEGKLAYHIGYFVIPVFCNRNSYHYSAEVFLTKE